MMDADTTIRSENIMKVTVKSISLPLICYFRKERTTKLQITYNAYWLSNES